EPIEGMAEPPAGRVTGPASPAGYLLGGEPNDAFLAVNRLIEDGEAVFRLREPADAAGRRWPAGTIYVRAQAGTRERIAALAAETGLEFAGAGEEPEAAARPLGPVRIGLWDR